jgi:hypothetical protein
MALILFFESIKNISAQIAELTIAIGMQLLGVLCGGFGVYIDITAPKPSNWVTWIFRGFTFGGLALDLAALGYWTYLLLDEEVF